MSNDFTLISDNKPVFIFHETLFWLGQVMDDERTAFLGSMFSVFDNKPVFSMENVWIGHLINDKNNYISMVFDRTTVLTTNQFVISISLFDEVK